MAHQDKMKGPWKEECKASHHLAGPSSYHLFPEPGNTPHYNMPPLLDVFSTDQPQTQVILPKQQSRSEGLTLDHPKVTQFPFHAMKLPSCLPTGEDINRNEATDMNVQVQMSNNVPVSACGSSLWFSNAPATMQQVALLNHGRSQSSYGPSSHAPGPVEGSPQDFADIMAVQQAYICALKDPDQITPLNLLHQSPQALQNHYAKDIRLMMSHYGESSVHSVTRQPQMISSSLTMQHSGRDAINHSGNLQQRLRSPVDNTLRIIHVKGKIAGLCADPDGSRVIQHALEMATVGEIIMVYEEVTPYARMLTIDVFGNYAIQKLLEHGPEFYKKKFISNLTGHVLPLSLHMYGCRVIQKAFEVADPDLKVQMANEFCGKVLKCARDQYANHVLQKCMECVPAQHIQFIFRSFCRKAKALSITPCGCRVIQKVLSFCNNPEIYHTIVSEIVEAIVKLALDPFGNYVVQHVVEHGGPSERSMIVKKFEGRVVSMSYHKYASNVIEKCLVFGSLEDRQQMTTEILNAGQHFDHLPGMMCHLYANFVIQKMVTAADEGQLGLLVEVAHRNMAMIMRHQHGRLVLAHIQKVLGERGMRLDMGIVDPQLLRQAAEE